MFEFLFKNKTKEEALRIIDEKIADLQEKKEKTYSRIRGYAESKDDFKLQWEVGELRSLSDAILHLEIVRMSMNWI